ncbi:MAG: hypothetical protein WEA36_10955 [Balneolaceae bacterium]
MMKKTILTLGTLVVWMLTASALQAQNRASNSELGIIVGEPTGISAKFWTGNNTAFDLGLAWSFSGQGSMHIHSSYLIHKTIENNPDLALYYGIGARLLMESDPKVGARVPLGLQYLIPDSRLSLFFELAPMLNLIPETDFDVNGGLGLRYFF